MPPSPALLIADLTPASRSQDHTPWPSALAPLVNGTSTSIASRPTFRDDAYAPLVEAGHRNFRFSESNIFRPRLEIPISLNPLTKLAFGRRRFRAVEGRASEMIRLRIDQTDLPDDGQISGGVGRRHRLMQLVYFGRDSSQPLRRLEQVHSRSVRGLSVHSVDAPAWWR